jgi:hypothetical protein
MVSPSIPDVFDLWNPPTEIPLSNCNDYILRQAQYNTTIYLLAYVTNTFRITFYSNCTGAQLGLSTIDTVLASGIDMYQKHMVSATCAINIDPALVGLSYYLPVQPLVISNIPTGYELNIFTLNPYGELSSSLSFVYTTEWVNVYQVQRISQNKIVVDEADSLNNQKVLWHIHGETLVDESDNLFGLANNGRDCIQQSSYYEFNLLDCFFQNDQTLYSISDYIKGLVRTAGVSRYINKFSMAISNVNEGNSSTLVTLTPLPQEDWTYFIDFDGQLCPKILQLQPDFSYCQVTLFYNGIATVTIDNTQITFDPVTKIAVFNAEFGESDISIGGEPCITINCNFMNSDTSYVTLSHPNISVINAADQALQGTLEDMSAATLNYTRQVTDAVRQNITIIQNNLTQISDALNQINFNISGTISFANFSAWREQVDKEVKTEF